MPFFDFLKIGRDRRGFLSLMANKALANIFRRFFYARHFVTKSQRLDMAFATFLAETGHQKCQKVTFWSFGQKWPFSALAKNHACLFQLLNWPKRRCNNFYITGPKPSKSFFNFRPISVIFGPIRRRNEKWHFSCARHFVQNHKKSINRFFVISHKISGGEKMSTYRRLQVDFVGKNYSGVFWRQNWGVSGVFGGFWRR